MTRHRKRKRIIRTYSIIVLMATVAALVRSFKPDTFSPGLNIFLFFVSVSVLSFSWEFFRFINKKLNTIFPFERSIPTRITIQLLTGTAFMLAFRFMVYLFGEPLFANLNFDKLFLAATWVLYVIAGVLINMIFFVDYFIEHWKSSIRRAERLEKEKAQVQFDNLKNQMNPHFLFNALTSLNSLITENQELASRFLQHLSKVYRYVLTNKDKNFVGLQTELDFIRNYVFLAETRFGGALKIQFDISQGALERAIVPVTLQVLIENAMKHNVIDHDRKLQIDVVTIGDYIVISNNLQKKKIVENSNKLGLENLKSLYAYLTDKPLLVEELGERFTVKVPLI